MCKKLVSSDIGSYVNASHKMDSKVRITQNLSHTFCDQTREFLMPDHIDFFLHRYSSLLNVRTQQFVAWVRSTTGPQGKSMEE